MKALLLAAVAAASASIDEPKQRTFELTYIAELGIPEGSERVQMWLPYPRRDDYQEVRLLSIESPVPTKLYQEYTYRNSMLFVSTPVADLGTLRVEMSFRVTRHEHRETDFVDLEDPEGWLESGVSRWLRADRLAPLDDAVLEQAEEVTQGRETVVDKAKAIFDYTVDSAQNDDADCAEFNGLARAAGIAAKFQIGFTLPEASGQGEIHGYRCWSEFYVPGFGWVPADPSAARENPDRREYFFGAHDANRVELTLGRDIVLNPKQSGEPLDYFIYPYAEIDGKPADSVRQQLFYKDLDVVAE